jgi:hypothetical protein
VPQTVILSSVVSTSDSTGTVSALATLGSTVGIAQVQVVASSGGQAIFNLTVRQPAATGGGPTPTQFTNQSGNNQTGTVGTRLALPLTAVVADASGTPLANVAVTWRPSASVSLTSVVSTSDARGVVSAIATPISTAAPVLVTLEAQGAAPTPFGYASVTISQTFNMTVGTGSTPPPATGTGSPAGIDILSGNNQTGPVGSPLVVQLTARVKDSSGNPLPNIPVTWLPSNSVLLTNKTTTSDSNGIVSATATPTSSTTPVQVVLQTIGTSQAPFGPAAGATISVTFSITVGAAPVTPPPTTGASTGYIAHIADGAEWKTTITVVNLLSVPQRVTLTFWNDSGQKWLLPIAGGSPVSQTFFDLQPNASAFLDTSGSAAAVATGWATVDGSVSGSSGVGASAIFRSHSAGRPDSAAVSAMSVATTKGVVIPFDNRNLFATGIAIANAGASGVIPITIRDQTGAVLLVDNNLTLNANGHTSFSMASRYPQIAAPIGTVEIGSTSAAVLGLRFDPLGPFTSVPPISKP